MNIKLIILLSLGVLTLGLLAYIAIRAWRYRHNHPKTLLALLLMLAAGQGSAWAQNTWSVQNISGSTFTVSRTNTSVADTVLYRTVNLSAVAGTHYTAKTGTLYFGVGEPSKSVTVTELTPSSNNAYKYQTSNRSYRFEVTDQGGFYLAQCDRNITTGTTVTSSGVFDVKDVTIQTAEYTADDDGYDNNGYKSVSSTSYCTSGTQAYLAFLSAQLRMTLSFEAKENDDAYEYLQLLVDNTTSCDNRSGCSNGDPGNISASRYMAGFEMNTGSRDDTYRSYTFPVTSVGNDAGATNPWGYGTKWPLSKQKFNTNCRATDGRIIIPTNFSTLVLRLNASGESGSDEWAAKNVKAHIQAVDETAPAKLDVTVNPGRHSKGNYVYVSVAFSEIVTVTGTPTLSTNNNWGSLSYIGGSGSNVLTFRGSISDNASVSLTVTGLSGTVKDLAGNNFAWSGTHTLCSLTDSYAWPISYDLAGGSVATPNPASYIWESATFTLTNPTRTGYTFDGWTGSNGNTPQTTVTVANHSHKPLSYTAHWTPITYNLTYDLDGGSVATANPATYSIESADFTLTNPTRTGYTFAGWTGTDLSTPTSDLTIAQGSYGDRSYTATWTPIVYNITYDLAGGSVDTPNPASYNIESADFTLTNPTRTGYTFLGWTGGVNSELSTPTSDLTIAQGSIGHRSYTAVWTPIVYNITYDLAGGSVDTPNPATYTIETPTFTLVNPNAPTGYTFAGWTGSDISTPTSDLTIAQGSTGDRSYTANWNNLWGVDADHDGTTAERAYIITTTAGLDLLATLVNGSDQYNGFSGTFFKLGADIAYTYASQWDDSVSTENNYTPIGNRSSNYNSFRGTFDGCGHTVSGIRIRASNDYKGLFGYISGGTVKNVTLSDSRITGRQYVGGIVGVNDHGTVENCHATATVAIYSRTSGQFTPGYHGGIVGRNNGITATATVVGCTSAATVSGTGNNYGGVVGWNSNATVSRCLALGAVVTGGSISGPVVGGSNNNNVTDCHHRHCTVGGNAQNDLYAVVAGTGVTLAPSGDATVAYPYGGLQLFGSAILCGDTLYAPANASVGLDLAYSGTVPEGYLLTYSYQLNTDHSTLNTDHSTLNTFTLTMPAADVTVGATFMPVVYNLTYDLDGGSADNPATYTIETPTFTLVNPTREGYTFLGWTGTGLASTTQTVTIVQGSTGDRSYTALWRINIPYVDADGNLQSCTDYTLVGSSSGDVTYGTDNQECWFVVSGDVTITGTLNLRGSSKHLILCDGASLTVTNSSNSAISSSDSGSTLAIYGQAAGTGILNASATGYQKDAIYHAGSLFINGGHVNAHVDGSASFALEASSSITVNGGSVQATGTRGLRAGNGNITLGWRSLSDRIQSISYSANYGSVIVKAGQHLTDGTAVYSGTLTDAQTTALAGQTLQPCFAVTLPEHLAATGVVSQTGTTAYAIPGATVTLAVASDYAGYSLTAVAVGGDPATDNGDGTWSFTMPAADVTVGATLTLLVYNITYDLAGGSLATANPATYTVETPDFTLANPNAPVGYTFAGWTGTDLSTPTYDLTIAQGSTGDRSYTATWTPIVYNLTYDLDGGTASNPATYTIETPTFTLVNPTREGYTFLGWTGTDLSTPTSDLTIAQGTTGHRSYTATWEIITYNLTYDLDGGSLATPNPATYTVETPTFTLANPTREGCTFLGWTGTDLSTPTSGLTIAQGSTGDRSYTAVWRVHVPYIDADGNLQTCTDYTLVESSNDQNTYYYSPSGGGWYVVDGDVTLVNFTFYDNDAHLILKDGATLTFNIISTGSDVALTIYGQSLGTGTLNGARISVQRDDLTINGGTLVMTPPYSSDAIQTLYNGNIVVNGGTVTATSANGNAVYSSSSLTINGGTVTATNTGNVNGSLYSRNGDITINGGIVTATAPTGFYAIVAGNNGDGTNPGCHNLNLSWTNPSDRISFSSFAGNVRLMAGKAFVDENDHLYYTNGSGSGYNSLGYAVTGHLLTPFTDYDREFSITYYPNGGTMPASYPTTYTYNTTVALPVPTREGYAFLGWTLVGMNDDVTELVAGHYLGDMVLYAAWAPLYTDVSYLDENGTQQTVQAKILYNNFTTFEGGIYTFSDGCHFSSPVTFTGNTTLILPDGESLSNYASDGVFSVDGNLTVYGQEVGNGGMLAKGLSATGNIALYGGMVRVIDSIVANGAGGTITLGWTGLYNEISADKYIGQVNLVKDFLYRSNDGTRVVVHAGTDIDTATINGKNLYPYFQTTTVHYLDENATRHTADATVLWGDESGTLPGGIYTVVGDVTFTHGLAFDGNTTLVLPDNSYLYIHDENWNPIAGDGITVNGNLALYGQENRNGNIEILASGDAIHASGNITVSNVSADIYDGNGIRSDADILVAGGVYYSCGTIAAGTITLGYLTMNDYIYSEAYTGTVTVRTGQTLIDYNNYNTYSGTLTDAQVSGIEGASLEPYIENPVTRTVESHNGSENGGWVFLASPVMGSIHPNEVGYMTSGFYDLYRYNSGTDVWENYRRHYDDFMLYNGRGYLYARESTETLEFSGAYNMNSTQAVSLEQGFNLVGNPFDAAATIDRPCYKMNAEGNGLVACATGTSIAVCEGVMVYSAVGGQSVTFSRNAPGSKGGLNLKLTNADGRQLDNAVVILGGEESLEKIDNFNSQFSIFNSSVSLSIPQDGHRYAVASVPEGTKAVPLALQATPGEFELKVESGKWKAQGGTYLHLIDRATGADVDLLRDSSYTFHATGNDAARFKVILSPTSDLRLPTSDHPFAYQDGDQLLIDGTGTLEAYDMMGRKLFSREANFDLRLPTSDFPRTGVYLLRLAGQSQKIVITK